MKVKFSRKVISPSPALPQSKAFTNAGHSVIIHESMGTYSARAIICCHAGSCPPSPPESNNVSSDGIFRFLPSYVYGHILSVVPEATTVMVIFPGNLNKWKPFMLQLLIKNSVFNHKYLHCFIIYWCYSNICVCI